MIETEEQTANLQPGLVHYCVPPQDTNRAAGLHSLIVAPQPVHKRDTELACYWSDLVKASSTYVLQGKRIVK